jgi:hypothetical protein
MGFLDFPRRHAFFFPPQGVFDTFRSPRRWVDLNNLKVLEDGVMGFGCENDSSAPSSREPQMEHQGAPSSREPRVGGGLLLPAGFEPNVKKWPSRQQGTSSMAMRSYPDHVEGCATWVWTWGQQQIPGCESQRAEKKKLKGECKEKKAQGGVQQRKEKAQGREGSREWSAEPKGGQGGVWVWGSVCVGVGGCAEEKSSRGSAEEKSSRGSASKKKLKGECK